MDELLSVIDQCGLGSLWALEGDAIVAVDTSGHVVRCNAALAELSQYDVSELLNMSMDRLIDERDLDSVLGQFARILEGHAARMVTRGRTKSGDSLYVEFTAVPVQGLDGRVVGLVAMVRNLRDMRSRVDEFDTRLGAARLAGRMMSFAGWTYDPATEMITWSPELRELLGHRPDEDVPVAMAPYLVHPRDQTRLQIEVQRSVQRDSTFAITVPVRRVDGEIREFRILGEAHRESSGAVRIDGAVHDVTDVLAHERTVVEAERRVTDTFNQLHVAIFLVNRDWKVSFANRAGEELLSMSSDELAQRTIWEWFPETTIKEIGALYHSAMENHQHGTVVEYISALDCWFEVVVYPYEDGILVAARDVTAERSGQVKLVELAQRETYLAEMLSVARDAMVVREFERGTVFWNRAAEEMWGYSFTDVRGDTSLDFLFDDVDAVRAIYELVVREGSWSGEVRTRHRDGHLVIIDAMWQVVRDVYGEAIGMFGVNRDVTKWRQEHDQLVRAQRMESIGTLAGGIAHDLNNVLTPAMVAMEIVDRHLSDPDDRRLIDGALESLKRGASMIRQVLAFARGVEGERVNVDVEHLLREVVTLARMTVPKGIEIDLELREIILPVLGDSTQLSQVFLNLVTNARDAIGEQGHIRIHAYNESSQLLIVGRSESSETLVRDAVVIEVSDDGLGMDDATMSKIFEPFFTTKALGVGSGLGLSTSLAIVRSHRGEMTVSSSLGGGATFRVVLPSSHSLEIRPSAATPPGSGFERVTTPRRILVVDDEDAISSLLELVLTRRGYEVDCLADGLQALVALRTKSYDVALIDLNMPELGGADLVRQIRDGGSTMRVIFMSGYGEDGVDSSLLAPGTYFLPKPFGVDDVIALLEVAWPT